MPHISKRVVAISLVYTPLCLAIGVSELWLSTRRRQWKRQQRKL